MFDYTKESRKRTSISSSLHSSLLSQQIQVSTISARDIQKVYLYLTYIFLSFVRSIRRMKLLFMYIHRYLSLVTSSHHPIDQKKEM